MRPDAVTAPWRIIANRYLWFFCWLLPACLLLSAGQAGGAPTLAEENLLLLEVRIDGQVLSSALPAYQSDGHILLPLVPLAELLTIALQAGTDPQTVHGFILQEDHHFFLSLTDYQVSIKGQATAVDPRLAIEHQGNVYVARQLLEEWLPLTLQVNLSTLRLQVKARQPLPLQKLLQRKRYAEKLTAAPVQDDSSFAALPLPYQWFSAPAVDQTVGLTWSRPREGEASADLGYTTFMTGDMLQMESSLYLRGNDHHPADDFRATLGRDDPFGRLLGPLHAKSVSLGSISVPGTGNITQTCSTGVGMRLSSYPLTRAEQFDRHSFQGDLPPGWDVELYFNEALIGYQQATENGQYFFDDIPLVLGPNEFRLVFHGPQGQLRVEKSLLMIDENLVRPGEFYYSLAGNKDDSGDAHALAQFDWGLHRHLSLAASVLHAQIPDERQYLRIGGRSFWQSLAVDTDVSLGNDGGAMSEVGFRTRLAGLNLGLRHIYLDRFTSEIFQETTDPVQSRSSARIDGALPLPLVTVLPFTLSCELDRLLSGREALKTRGRFTMYRNGISLTNELRHEESEGSESTDWTMRTSRRYGRFWVRGQANYNFDPDDSLSELLASLENRLGRGYMFNQTVSRTFNPGRYHYTVGLVKTLGAFGLQLNAGYGDGGEVRLGVQVFMGLGMNPRTDEVRYSALPKANVGTASARVFLDQNRNSVMDPGEEPLAGVGFLVNGSKHKARTDADGIATLDQLTLKRPMSIAVNAATLEDPFWTPAQSGVCVIPRPGRAALMDFPIIMTTEIDGTVFLAEEGKKRPVSDVVLELVNDQGKVIGQTRSAWDGYYVLTAVPPGPHLVRVSPEQIRERGLREPAGREVEVVADGTLINGLDFVLAAPAP